MGQYDSWEYLTNFIKKNIGNFQDELAKPPYAVKTKQHPSCSNFYMFKYSQFESDFTNPVVRCCRGSVYDIRENGMVKPILMPFLNSPITERPARILSTGITVYMCVKSLTVHS